MPKKIEFVWAKTSEKKITLNHTDKDATISADIVSGSEGPGYINALNGTTYLTGDNSAFSGKVTIEKKWGVGDHPKYRHCRYHQPREITPEG